MNERRQKETGITLQEVLDEGKRLTEAGDLAGALLGYARALPRHGSEEALLAVAAETWVAAVDGGGALESLPQDERQSLQRSLILQEDCAASPPILHHRIAAQHSGGVTGHLNRAAAALETTLEALLADGDDSANMVLMLLLLRSGLRRIDQGSISALHFARFAQFREGDLRIPYSVVFDRVHFERNVADLSDYVRVRGEALVDGSLPLDHLLLLSWLVPAAFDALPPDWSARAVRARLAGGPLDGHEAASARSLAMRFGGDAHRTLACEGVYGSDPNFVGVMEAVDRERRALAAASGDDPEPAMAKLEARPRQALWAAWNLAGARVPAITRLRRRPRVAVCISGQLRGFRQTWETWRPLLAGVDATVFVSSWSRIGRGTPEPFRSVLPFEGNAFATEYRALGTDMGLDGLRERYPVLFTAFESSGVVTRSELSELYGTPHIELDDESAAAFRGFGNSDKMHYKVERCFRMAQESGEEYDLILRMRPDKPIVAVAFDWADMLTAARARPVLYCETAIGVHYGALLMGDQFALGAPGPSALYAETWSRTVALRKLDLFKFEPELTGHSSMAQSCWLHGVDVRKVPVKFGKFQEAQPLSASVIRQTLAQDAAGRMDRIDDRFVKANAADLARVG